jgi:hypothetical protein
VPGRIKPGMGATWTCMALIRWRAPNETDDRQTNAIVGRLEHFQGVHHGTDEHLVLLGRARSTVLVSSRPVKQAASSACHPSPARPMDGGARYALSYEGVNSQL